MKAITQDWTKLQQLIELTIQDLKSWQGEDISYTVTLRLWDDGTYSIDARYGDDESIFISTWYQNKITQRTITPSGNCLNVTKTSGEYVINWLTPFN